MVTFSENHPLSKKWVELTLYNNTEQIMKLFAYDELGIKVLPSSSKKMVNQKTRAAILKVLDEGIDFGGWDVRYAMSALELSECIGSKLTVIYFHVQKLIQSGHIHEIEVLSDGRYDTAFYARTGKLYLYIADYISGTEKVCRTLLGSEVSEHLIEEYVVLRERAAEEIETWMANHPEVLTDPELLYITLLHNHPALNSHELGVKISDAVGRLLHP